MEKSITEIVRRWRPGQLSSPADIPVRLLLIVLLTATQPVRAQLKFITPIEGEPFRDWTIVNYVDRDPGAGILDYAGGAYSYNGHQGIDFTLPHFIAMDTGVNILAAADGVVTALHDGEFDRNTGSNGLPANFITIRHADGSETSYWHLKRNSIRVSVNDTVRTGDRIALTGSSGNSTDAHLHFEVRHNGTVIDPFFDGRWISPIPYAGQTPGVMDSGMTDRFSSFAEFKEGPRKMLFFGLNQLCVHWVQLFAVDPSDVMRWEFRTPAGALFSQTSVTPAQLIRYGWYHAGWNLPGNMTGKWQSRFFINGVLLSQLDFYASALQDTDGDGVYDDAETAPFVVGQNDALRDSDADGAGNVTEFFMATNPASAASRPVVQVARIGPMLELSYAAPSGRRVFVQRGVSPAAAAWNNYRHACSGPSRLLKVNVNDFGPRSFFKVIATYDH